MLQRIGELRKEKTVYQRTEVKLEPIVDGFLVTYQQCPDRHNPGCWCKQAVSTLDDALNLAAEILEPPVDPNGNELHP